MFRTQRELIVFAAVIFLFQYVASVNSDTHWSMLLLSCLCHLSTQWSFLMQEPTRSTNVFPLENRIY
jgi:hypothetical protein